MFLIDFASALTERKYTNKAYNINQMQISKGRPPFVMIAVIPLF